MKGVFEDLTGQTFGRWTVLYRDFNVPNQCASWRCRCACGTENTVSMSNLKAGKSKSCGCRQEESYPCPYTRTAWRNIPAGERGARWQGAEGYVRFVQDMGERPFHQSLCRRDESQLYTPENCFWGNACKGRLRVGLPGERYGRWTILGQDAGPSPTGSYRICRCDCGEEWSVRLGSLLSGRSAGCMDCKDSSQNGARKRTTPRVDLTDRQVGSWTVRQLVSKNDRGDYFWECQCACGALKHVSGFQLRKGVPAYCKYCAQKARAAL